MADLDRFDYWKRRALPAQVPGVRHARAVAKARLEARRADVRELRRILGPLAPAADADDD